MSHRACTPLNRGVLLFKERAYEKDIKIFKM